MSQRTMNEPDRAGYRNRLKDVIEDGGYSVPYLSELTGIPLRTLYSYIQHPHRLVISRYAELLSRHIKVDPLELITWMDADSDNEPTIGEVEQRTTEEEEW